MTITHTHTLPINYPWECPLCAARHEAGDDLWIYKDNDAHPGSWGNALVFACYECRERWSVPSPTTFRPPPPSVPTTYTCNTCSEVFTRSDAYYTHYVRGHRDVPATR